MSFSLILLPLLAQMGPGGALPQAPLQIPRKRPAAIAAAPLESSKLIACLTEVRGTPATGLELAENWLEKAKGPDRADAAQCQGAALSGLNRWNDAVAAFGNARLLTTTTDLTRRARLSAMAGNAALAADTAAAADTLFAQGHADALAAPDPVLAADIAADWSRALVALGRSDDAAARLADARSANPGSAPAWLLSATLSRRRGMLGDAQAQIETAARLAPLDPEIGLEAGVVAVLAGRDGAARQSWQSVLSAAPGSPSAKTAQSYLDQLGPDPAPVGR